MKLTHFSLGRLLVATAAILVFGGSTLFAQVTVIHNASGGLTDIRASSALAPIVIAGPVNRLAAPGQNAAFSVLVTGTAPLSYQWSFNNNIVAGATGDSLLVTNLTLSDLGAYQVLVANAFGSVTSSGARLDLDADGDGLPDSWEITYFGSITNQAGAFDKDHDGTDNLTEYLDGTNPTNALSLLPRLTVVSYRCLVSVNPLLETYTNGQPVTLTAFPDAGQTFISWSGATNSTSNVVTILMTSNKTVIAQAGLPLAESLDVTNRVVTGGDIAWFGESSDTHDGVAAARSGRMTSNSQTSWVQITNVMSGEGTITFWWKVDSQAYHDYLKFLINGVLKPGQISGFANWNQKTYYLTSGVSVLRWEYTKDSSDGYMSDAIPLTTPADAAWVDQVVFEVYVDPLRDTDGDGLPDLWEYRYFYSLNQTAAGDPDNDGISNLDEYLDGTDPTSNSSQKPRLTLLSEGAGTVSANPNKPKYNYGEMVTNSAVPAISNFFVMWTGSIFDTNTITKVTMSGSKMIKGVFGFALDLALDGSGLAWTRGGAAGWYGQTNVSHDGVDAAQSAPIYSGQESWMETTVIGPGCLSFWWKVSCLLNANSLRLNLNGVEQSYRISGDVDWQPQFYYFGPGTNTFRWRFVRNNYSTNFTDAGWVDQVTFTPGDIAPAILSQPSNQTVLQGSNVTLTSFAVGTPTLMYEWLRNGTVISPASTNGSYTITNISPAQGGSGYSVRVSNAASATNGVPFAITVLPVPPVNDDFSNRISMVGLSNSVSGYNFGATRETGEPSHAGSGGSRSVWWSWVAPQSGMFRLHASSQGISSLLLAVYTGGAVNALTPVASVVSYGNYSNGTYYAEAEVLFSGVTNTAYALAVDTGSGGAGWIQLALSYVPPPPNDLFANRILLQGTSVAGSGYNIGATAESGEPDHAGFGGPSNSVWWAWSPPHSGTARLNAQGTTFSPAIAVYSGSSVTSLSPVASGFFSTQIDFAAVSGVSYAIAFDGYFGGMGNIQFTLGMLTPVINLPVFVPGSAVQMTFTGLPGATYVLETSTDLTAWLPVSTNTPPPSGTMTLTNYPPTNDRARFYRIMVQ